MRTVDVGIIIVGNEILQGFTKDTNSGYLAEHITKMGHRVNHVSTVREHVPDIVGAIRTQLKAGYWSTVKISGV